MPLNSENLVEKGKVSSIIVYTHDFTQKYQIKNKHFTKQIKSNAIMKLIKSLVFC